MTQPLAPCPFCGGEAQRFTIGDSEPDNAGGDVITCTRCGASSHVEFGRKENLVSAWNTRSPDLLAMVEKMADGVELAANRLHRLSVEAIVSGDERLKCSVLDWADEARATLTEYHAMKGDGNV